MAREKVWQIEGVLNNDIVGGNRTPGDKEQDSTIVRVFSEGIPSTVPVDAGASQDRQAQGPAAEYRQRKPLSDLREGPPPGTPPPRRPSPPRSPPAAALDLGPRRRPERPRRGRQGNHGFPLLIINTGSAPAEEVELSSSSPSGWKIEFDPKTVDRIPVNATQPKEVQVRITSRRREGDCRRLRPDRLRSPSRGETASTQFRVAVGTSNQWG